MIVVHRETIGNGAIFDMNVLELVCIVEFGRIDNEVERIRNEYGEERELIKSRNNDDVCLVYDKWKYYVCKT